MQGARQDLRRPALRQRRVHEPPHGRDQDPDGVHGRLPAHDREGHLHHQRHRARRGVPARALARRLLRPHPREALRQGHLLRAHHPEPRRLARVRDRQARPGRRAHRPQAQAVGHGLPQGARDDQRGDPRGVQGLPVDRPDPREGCHPHQGRGAQGHLPQAPAGRAGRRRGRARAPRQLLLQPQALRPREGRSLQDQPQARPRRRHQAVGAHDRGHHRDHQVPRRVARHHLAGCQHRRERRRDDRGRARRQEGGCPPRRGRHRPLRQPPHPRRRRAHPEPGAHGTVPHGARRARAHDHAGHRGDNPPDPDQRAPRRRRDQGVLRHEPACRSSWTRTTRSRA